MSENPPPATPPGFEKLEGEIVADRFRALKKMGRGGMGVVYVAEHVTLEKRLALKVLHPRWTRNREVKQRFLLEARAAAKVKHDNIVDITDFGSTGGGSFFIAMELLEGEDLGQLLEREHRLSWRRARPLLLQMLSGLEAAHDAGIVHRDMKPANVFLDTRRGPTPRVKILDFGVAKMTDCPEGQSLTQSGTLVGTPEYLSPELVRGKRPDGRADVYSVGIIAYQMLTGQRPFKASSVMEVLTKQMFYDPQPPSLAAPDAGIPPAVDPLVMRALAKDIDQRYQSARELALAVEDIPASAGPGTGPAGPREGSTPESYAEGSSPTLVSGPQAAVTVDLTTPKRSSERSTPERSSGERASEGAPGRAPAAARRRTWPGVLLGGGLALVVAALVVLGLRWSRGPAPATAPAPDPAPEPPAAARQSVAPATPDAAAVRRLDAPAAAPASAPGPAPAPRVRTPPHRRHRRPAAHRPDARAHKPYPELVNPYAKP
jgi:serine/threonine-protein kinase